MSLYTKRQVMEWLAKHQGTTLEQAIRKLAKAPVATQKAVLTGARQRMERIGYVPPKKPVGRPASTLSPPQEPGKYIVTSGGRVFQYHRITKGDPRKIETFSSYEVYLPCEVHDGPGHWTLDVLAQPYDDAHGAWNDPARQAVQEQSDRVVHECINRKAATYDTEVEVIRHVKGDDT